MEAMTGKGRFQYHIVNDGQLGEGSPLVVDQISIHNMSCPAIEDRLFKDCTVDAGAPEAPIELAFEARRVYDLAHICSVHHADEVYLPCFCIYLNLHKAHHT